MSLRLKLLLLGLATLVLPWGGCQYAREMESALREGEENSLQAVSQTIAASLQGPTDLLYREAPPPADAPEAPPDETSGHAFLQSGPYDLKPLALTAAPLLDGYSDDWPHDPSAWAYFARDDRHRFRSEEHTSELQSQFHLVCRLLLEKKKTTLLLHPTVSRHYHTRLIYETH